MTDNSALLLIARAKAAEHKLDAALVCSVIEQESSWNTWAVRFEPGFLKRYVAPMFAAGKLTATEAYARSFSWGLMQVMGEVARERGFTGESLAELCDPSTGIELGCRKLAAALAHSNGDVSAALESYNGGSNPSYASEVLARKTKYV